MKKNTNNQHKGKQFFTYSTIALLFMVFITIGSMIYFKVQIQKSVYYKQAIDYKVYEKHYVLITSQRSTSFWKQVYEGAKEEAENKNAYLELFGENLAKEYRVEELMQIAIETEVDGIILEANESEKIGELINEAVANGIPVVTALGDNTFSDRQSFVGLSSFNLGKEYGKQICDISSAYFQEQVQTDGSDLFQVMVLVNSNADDTSQNIVFSSIQETVENTSVYGERIKIEAKVLNSVGAFSSEEAIRDIFMGEAPLPDMIVCLNELDTTCVYQAVVDYNKVGELQIVGYYDSTTILKAIERNVIQATISVDAKGLGKYGVNAISEYQETGRVSNYFSVDTTLINGENVGQYLGGVTDE